MLYTKTTWLHSINLTGYIMSIKNSHIQEDINYCVGDHVGQWYKFVTVAYGLLLKLVENICSMQM